MAKGALASIHRRQKLAQMVRSIDAFVVVSRRGVTEIFDRVHLELQVFEAVLDPGRSAWIHETVTAVKDGTIPDRIDRQPTPEAIVDEWYRSRPA